MPIRRAAAAAALILLSSTTACRNDALAPAGPLTGDWGPSISLVGSHWTMHLVERGAALTGTGEYAFEAGRSGALAVTGSASGERVTLDITYDYGLRERFVGVHTNLDVLHGTSTRVLGADTTTVDTDLYRRGTP